MTEAQGRAVRVREPVWRGVQAIDGLWLDAGFGTPAQRCERMLALWTPGCRAWRFAQGDALCFARPRWLDCARLPGTPLRRLGARGWFAGPLQADERQALAEADVHLVVGAEVVSLDFAAARALDLSESIVLDDYAVHEAYDCSDTVGAAAARERLASKSVREALGRGVPEASPEQAEFLRAARARGAGQAPLRAPGGFLAEQVRALRDRVAGWVSAWLSRPTVGTGAGVGAGSGGEAAGGAAGVAARAQPQAAQPWRKWLARAAVLSRASRVLGLRQGAYLRRLLQRFDEGELDEALRHALPLGGGSGADGGWLGMAFGVPGRRDRLELSRGVSGRTSIGLDEQVGELLRQAYRRAYERLHREGRHDEAVFVLAELLGAKDEALDYLVQRQRLAEAAELALGWDMEPGRIIQLLMQAGDLERAVLVARRDDAFAHGVALLEQQHPEAAQRLRREWGQALAERGEWLAAVDAVWPLPDARESAEQWLSAAESGGGEWTARALVQRASLMPDTLARYQDVLQRWIQPGAQVHARLALAESLASVRHRAVTPSLRRLATQVLPAVAADCAAGQGRMERSALDRLRALSDDPWLRVDLPAWRVAEPLRPQPLWRAGSGEPPSWSAPAAGLQAPLDAAALGDGRWLLALGEAGAAVVGRDGRCQRRYAVPAHELVLGDSGRVALALARRDSLLRVARLDLSRHQVTDLGALADVRFHADRFDGIGWSVIARERLWVLDASRPGLEPLWSVGEFGGRVEAAAFFRHDDLLLANQDGQRTLWHYRHSAGLQRRLVAREPLRLPQDRREHHLHPAWRAISPRLSMLSDGHLALRCDLPGRTGSVLLAPPDPERPVESVRVHALAHGLCVAVGDGTDQRLHLVDFDDRVLARIHWPGSEEVRVRDQPDRLALFDARGRAMEILSDSSLCSVVSLL